jgi:hypothetical protein
MRTGYFLFFLIFWKKGSICGHAFVAIHTQKIRLGNATVDNIPIPNEIEIGIQLPKAAGITLPSVFPHKPVNVHTN